MNNLTFSAFRQANVARAIKWHPQGIASWSPSDWLTAITGELGELASLIKMRCRERDGLPGNKFSPTDRMLADELADVFTYLDLLAEVLGVDLGAAAVAKFNEVSERVGFSDRIALAACEAPAEVVPSNNKAPESSSAAPVEAVEVLRDLAMLSKLVDVVVMYRTGSKIWPDDWSDLRERLSAAVYPVAQPPQSVQEDERDAKRYRWLRDVSVPPHNFYISVPDEFNGTRYSPQEVDAYIDAAISGATTKEPE